MLKVWCMTLKDFCLENCTFFAYWFLAVDGVFLLLFYCWDLYIFHWYEIWNTKASTSLLNLTFKMLNYSKSLIFKVKNICQKIFHDRSHLAEFLSISLSSHSICLKCCNLCENEKVLLVQYKLWPKTDLWKKLRLGFGYNSKNWSCPINWPPKKGNLENRWLY